MLPVKLLNAALANPGGTHPCTICGFEIDEQFSAHHASVARLKVGYDSPRSGDREKLIVQICDGLRTRAVGGRPRKLTDPKKVVLVKRMHEDKQTDIVTICQTLCISKATLYRIFQEPTPE